MKKIIIYLFAFLVSISLAYAIILDEDGDGVPDSEDKCYGSIGMVDSFGCECSEKKGCTDDWCCIGEEECIEDDFRVRCVGDLDNDGVWYIDDRCHNTPANEIVDNDGCSCSQKICDDDNPCTDNYCNEEVECFFVNNNTNYCGKDKECIEGFCVYLAPGCYYIYDEEEGTLTIICGHSAHTVEVFFEGPLKEDVIILDSTSNIISYGLSEDRTKLTLVIEGDPDIQGVTNIRTMQKPISVTIDEIEIPERKEKGAPRNNIWLYFLAIFVMFVLIFVFVLSQRRHEDEIMTSIKREEGKIEKEVDLEAELQLKMYITTNLRRGYTAQQIRNELLRDGWKKGTLDRVFDSLRRR